MSMMNALNGELVKAIGHPGNWMQLIRSYVMKNNGRYVQRGLLDDIVTDVVAGLVESAPKLAPSLEKAKATDDPDKNVQSVICQAVKFRVSDARRKLNRYMDHSPLEDPLGEDGDVSMLGEDPLGEDGDVSMLGEASYIELHETNYERLLVKELELMAVAAEWKSATRLAARLRLAKLVVPDRLAGDDIYTLMDKHGVKSTSTMQAILDDIGEALKRVAVELDDPVLLAGCM